jgi:pimeloyl-ACP methyl ester carboxylesterase
VVGEDDVTEFPLEDADLYARGIRDARLMRIEKAGHLACIEQPEEFNRLLDAFLSQIEG